MDFVNGPSLMTNQGAIAFTRATARSIVDHEGMVRHILSGEAGFEGYRRVRNCVAISEDFENAAWAKTTLTVTSGVTDPLGGSSAFTIAATGAGALISDTNPGAAVIGQQYVTSCWMRRRTGVGNVQLRDVNGTNQLVTISSEWKRISGPVIANNDGNVDCAVRIVDIGDEVDIWRVQVENVTSQANEAPGEYVSVGVLSSPFHGAGVDGVKYFTTQNGNTVASNVVTEAAGAALNPTTVIKGLSIWEARTNLCLQSENFGVTWGVDGTPTRVAANARCGDVVLDLIGDDDGAAVEAYRQTVTFTGDAVKAISLFVKQGTSTESVVRLVDTTLVAERLLASVTWVGGVPAIAMTTGTHEGTDALCNGVYRIRFTTASVTATSVNSLRLYQATTVAFAVANTGTINMGGVQCENALFCGPYIPTTTATVTRNAELAEVSTLTPWFNEAEGTLVLETLYGVHVTGDQVQVAITDAAAAEETILRRSGASSITFIVRDGGATQASVAPAAGAGNNTIVKAAGAYKVNDFQAAGNGVLGIADSLGTLPTPTKLHIGSKHPNSFHANSNLRKFDYYPRRLPDATLQALST